MKKRQINIIIGIMAAALIGIIALQFYWINWSVKLSQRQFDESIAVTLTQIVQKIEKEEGGELFSLLYKSTPIIGQGANLIKKMEEFRLNQMAGIIPIEERINAKKLDLLMKSAFPNITFSYGVYSRKRKRFVIKDGHYLVPEFETSISGERELLQSRYKVNLFSTGRYSPGLLVVYFPTMSKAVWQNAWIPFLLAALFTGLILLSFGYTLYIIFEQKKLSEMKTDFINNMTHEFKTPIATISLASDSIVNEKVLNNAERVKRFVGIIKQENRRLLNQVEKVLQMAKLDKRDLKLNKIKFDIHDVIRDVVTHGQLQVAPKGGEIFAKLEATQSEIVADRNHISNVLHNLIDNANKYSKEIPKITILTRNVKNGVEIEVKDNGVGISKEAQKHIFDRFYRVHTGDVHDVKGFGLGLSYVKVIVDAHKGSVGVESELGKGSSFLIWLPFEAI